MFDRSEAETRTQPSENMWCFFPLAVRHVPGGHLPDDGRNRTGVVCQRMAEWHRQRWATHQHTPSWQINAKEINHRLIFNPLLLGGHAHWKTDPELVTDFFFHNHGTNTILLVSPVGNLVLFGGALTCSCSAGANRPSVDIPEGRLPPTKQVGVQGPSEGEEECGGKWDRPAGEHSAQDRERGMCLQTSPTPVTVQW